MLKKDLFRPAGFPVAVLALFILLAFMYVIRFMAAVTLAREVFFAEYTLVAGCANQFFVLASEWKFGVSGMIKLCVFPAVLLVTGAAFLSVASPVAVVILVAAVACFFGLLFAQCFCMTGSAGNVPVFTSEFELGFPVMIEF